MAPGKRCLRFRTAASVRQQRSGAHAAAMRRSVAALRRHRAASRLGLARAGGGLTRRGAAGPADDPQDQGRLDAQRGDAHGAGTPPRPPPGLPCARSPPHPPARGPGGSSLEGARPARPPAPAHTRTHARARTCGRGAKRVPRTFARRIGSTAAQGPATVKPAQGPVTVMQAHGPVRAVQASEHAQQRGRARPDVSISPFPDPRAIGRRGAPTGAPTGRSRDGVLPDIGEEYSNLPVDLCGCLVL